MELHFTGVNVDCIRKVLAMQPNSLENAFFALTVFYYCVGLAGLNVVKM